MNIQDLSKKTWYRAVKVLYIILYILVILLVFLVLKDYKYDWATGTYSMASFPIWVMTYSIIFVILEMIKKTFFYIVTGKW